MESSLSKKELYKYLYRGLVPYKSLKPEQRICVEFNNALIERAINGKLPFLWFHIPNEFYKTSGRGAGFFGAILGAMGRLPGVADYCFVSKEISFFIEFKSKKGRLSENQETFQKWCNSLNVKYFVCRSCEEGMKVIDEMGGANR